VAAKQAFPLSTSHPWTQPWASPNHPGLRCRDRIIAEAGDYDSNNRMRVPGFLSLPLGDM
jgi:hypothetical protein